MIAPLMLAVESEVLKNICHFVTRSVLTAICLFLTIVNRLSP